jgi:RNA polymerase sigma-70 factor (ECF subfamily)
VSAARVISQHQGDSLSVTSEAVQFISDERFVAVAKGHGTDFDELHTHQAEGIAENRDPIGGRPGHYRPRKLRRAELHQQELKTFEEILLTSRAKFVAMADTILRDKEDAEDAVQNGFLSAYVHFRNFEGRSALRTWLTRIVLNAALMVLRRRKRIYVVPRVNPDSVDEITGIPQIPDSQPDPEKIYADEETFRRIDAELERMSPTLRQAFAMTYYRGMSNREVCEVLGIPICRLNARVFRARKLIVTRVSPSSAALGLKKTT